MSTTLLQTVPVLEGHLCLTSTKLMSFGWSIVLLLNNEHGDLIYEVIDNASLVITNCS
jgi:hypothetical protein